MLESNTDPLPGELMLPEVEPEPAEVGDRSRRELRAAAGGVEVLGPVDERAARATGALGRQGERARVADVQVAGGGGR